MLDSKDLLHKVHEPSKDDSLYLLQQATILYDTGASTSAVKGDFANRVGFEVIDPKSQTISMAGGATVPTGYGTFGATIGPDDDGMWYSLNLLGMTQITSNIPKFELGEIVNEVKSTESSSTLASETFPKYVGGDEIKIIIGVSESFLIPQLILIL